MAIRHHQNSGIDKRVDGRVEQTLQVIVLFMLQNDHSSPPQSCQLISSQSPNYLVWLKLRGGKM